jgi:hypothetical protein
VKNRLDLGTFKKIIMAKYGIDNDLFTHYFEKKE